MKSSEFPKRQNEKHPNARVWLITCKSGGLFTEGVVIEKY